MYILNTLAYGCRHTRVYVAAYSALESTSEGLLVDSVSLPMIASLSVTLVS